MDFFPGTNPESQSGTNEILYFFEEALAAEHVEDILKDFSTRDAQNPGFHDLTTEEVPPSGDPGPEHRADPPREPETSDIDHHEENEASKILKPEEKSSGSGTSAGRADLPKLCEKILGNCLRTRLATPEELKHIRMLMPDMEVAGARISVGPKKMVTPLPRLSPEEAHLRWGMVWNTEGSWGELAQGEWKDTPPAEKHRTVENARSTITIFGRRGAGGPGPGGADRGRVADPDREEERRPEEGPDKVLRRTAQDMADDPEAADHTSPFGPPAGTRVEVTEDVKELQEFMEKPESGNEKEER